MRYRLLIMTETNNQYLELIYLFAVKMEISTIYSSNPLKYNFEVLEYFYFVLLHFSTPPHFGGKYFTFTPLHLFD